jgi:hypothetical protein
MNMWKLVDMYGRCSYYEDEKSFFRRYKYQVGEEAVERYRYEKDQASIPSWLKTTQGYQVTNDNWVPVYLDKKVMDDTAIRRIDKWNKWNQAYLDRLAKFREVQG